MSKPLDELYFTWLYSQVGSVDEKNPSRTYWRLLRQLYCKEFIWLIPNDDNRAEDGLELKYDFAHDQGINISDTGWLSLGCSMLELVIGLSRRLSFESDEGEPFDWFWQLVENLELELFNDNTKLPTRKINNRLDDVIWRTYRRDGHGGLFPLNRSRRDQRNVELWYQMQQYLLERS